MKWIGRIFMIALVVLIFIAAGGQAVLHLWNWLLPPLFGWKVLTFWQAVGLLALCRILFGNVGGRPRWRSDSRRRMSERWQNMTPEERERFKHGIPSPCGGVTPPAGEAKGSV
jgi:uncharacterized membrane protein